MSRYSLALILAPLLFLPHSSYGSIYQYGRQREASFSIALGVEATKAEYEYHYVPLWAPPGAWRTTGAGRLQDNSAAYALAVFSQIPLGQSLGFRVGLTGTVFSVRSYEFDWVSPPDEPLVIDHEHTTSTAIRADLEILGSSRILGGAADHSMGMSVLLGPSVSFGLSGPVPRFLGVGALGGLRLETHGVFLETLAGVSFGEPYERPDTSADSTGLDLVETTSGRRSISTRVGWRLPFRVSM